MDLERKIRRKLKETFTETLEVPGRGYEFRASSLPFCPRAMSISHVLKERDEAPSGGLEHKMQSIFAMGHGVHAATQHWLGMVGYLFGHWRCQAPLTRRRYKKLRKLRREHKHDSILGPALDIAMTHPRCNYLVERDYLPGTRKAEHKRCPECGNESKALWDYVEFTISDPKTGMSAHPDGYLPKFKAILEIKTTGSRYMGARKEPNWEHWLYQASVYGSLLEEREKLPVERIVLVYFGRDKIEHKVFVRPIMKHVLPTTRKAYLKTKDQIHLKILPKGICSDSVMAKWDIECSYAGICFSPTLAKQLGLKDA